MRGPYAVMWSGGKDCALALDRARRAGLDVRALVNFHDGATRRVRFHATRVEMLEAQASALRIDLIKAPTAWNEMDRELRERLHGLRSDGFAGVVFGDIHLEDVRAWYEERVTAAGLEHVEPLWEEPPHSLLSEFVGSGGRAVVTCIDRTRLDESWLGRIVDEAFLAEIEVTACDPCGENGEYHTFVYAGPQFKGTINWVPGRTFEDGPFLQLDIREPARSSAPVP